MNSPECSEEFKKSGKSLVTDPPKKEKKWPEDFRFGSKQMPPKFGKK